ncbi:hypothetical protein [Streptomyces sp. NPDC006640]|uniref:hypothetical protein n=1 Tax=unclassified Streptomyces TaxID=2593676 RepID=UPI0036AE1C06
MFGRKGKHTTRELIRRLRSENVGLERQMGHIQKRLRDANEQIRTETTQREMAEGIVLQQTVALQELNDRVAQLERELSERTVEMPLPARPELVEAVA